MTDAPERKKSFDAALMSIGFLLDVTDRLLWRCGGGRGAWEGCLAALVLAKEPGLRTRRLIEALPAEGRMDSVGLLNTMAHLGYYSDRLSMPLGDIEPRLVPCVFVPEKGGAPLTVLAKDGDSLTVYDGTAHAMRVVPCGDATPGAAFFFIPYEQSRDKMSKFMREGFGRSWFGGVVRRFSGTVRQILVTCLALNIFALAPSLFVMMVYDRIISPQDLSALPALAAGVCLAMAAEHLLRDARSEGLAWMTARLDNLVGGRIFSHLVSLPPETLEQASVASQVARVKTFESVRDFFSSAVFLSFIEIPFVVLAAVLMAALAGRLILVPLAMIGCYAALFLAMRHYIKGAIRLAAKSSSARQMFSIETFEKLRFVRMNGLERAWNSKFDELQGREVLMNFHLSFLGTIAETLANALTILAAVFTVGYGVHLVWAGEMSMGALIASMILVWRILLPFYSLCTMIPRLEQLRNSVAQVNSLMEMETEQEKSSTAVLPSVRGHLAFENIAFGYEGTGEQVLSGLGFTLPAGGVAAIAGRNGVGKSTLLKLAKGLARPQEGMIRIDGFDIRQIDAQDLRCKIGYVPQKADFFPGTLLENLVVGNPLARLADVEKALRRADAWDEIGALPGGLQAEAGHGRFGYHLSAKLSLARAYLQDARILLIDELPNAVLNGPAGRNLKEYILLGKGRRTVLMVTHRNDLLEISDTIVHLSRGAPARAGARDTLIRLAREAA